MPPSGAAHQSPPGPAQNKTTITKTIALVGSINVGSKHNSAVIWGGASITTRSCTNIIQHGIHQIKLPSGSVAALPLPDNAWLLNCRLLMPSSHDVASLWVPTSNSHSSNLHHPQINIHLHLVPGLLHCSVHVQFGLAASPKAPKQK